MAREEVKVFHQHEQHLQTRGITDFMAYNWNHEFELCGVCRVVGLSVGRRLAGT